MNRLTQQSINDIRTEIAIATDGKATISIKGLAKMLGVADTSIIRGAAIQGKKLSETLARHGIDPSAFSREGIPDIAVALIASHFAYKANKKSKQAEAVCESFMAIGVRAWIKNVLKGQEDAALVARSIEQQDELAQSVAGMIDLSFSGTNLSPSLIAGIKLNALAAIDKKLAPAAEAGRAFLASNTTIKSALCTPTALGKVCGRSAQAINNLLIEKGLQRRTSDSFQGSAKYAPTAKGKKYSEFTISTGRNNSTSYQHLKWYEDVLIEIL
jgi:hypothetical protein